MLLRVLLALAFAPRDSHAGICGDLQERLKSIDEECCDEPTESCTDGRPKYCNDACASIFLDVWSDCKEELRRVLPRMSDYDPVVTMCYQTEMSPCKDVPCLNGGHCHWDATGGGNATGGGSGHRRLELLAARNTPPSSQDAGRKEKVVDAGASRRQLQAGAIVCVCPPGFKGLKCEQCSQPGMDPNYYCLRPLAKPAKSKYCTKNPDLCCQLYAPNIANVMRHMMDLSSIRRLVERIQVVATDLSLGDWSISPKVDAYCSKPFRCSSGVGASACNMASMMTGGKCFFDANANACMPTEGSDEICLGDWFMREKELCSRSCSADANKLIDFVADVARSTLKQIPKVTRDPSKAPPPDTLDIDLFLLELVEGDWAGVFERIETLSTALHKVQWAKLVEEFTNEKCDEECQKSIDQSMGYLDAVMTMTGRIKNLMPKPDQTKHGNDGNVCRLSMLSIQEILKANLDLGSIKQSLVSAISFLSAAREVDWRVEGMDKSHPLVDEDTADDVAKMLKAVQDLLSDVLRSLGPETAAKAPTKHIVGDVNDWLIDLFSSDIKALGQAAGSILSSVRKVNWRQEIPKLATALNQTNDTQEQDYVDFEHMLAVAQRIVDKAGSFAAHTSAPDSECKPHMISIQDLLFENLNAAELSKMLIDWARFLEGVAKTDFSFSHETNDWIVFLLSAGDSDRRREIAEHYTQPLQDTTRCMSESVCSSWYSESAPSRPACSNSTAFLKMNRHRCSRSDRSFSSFSAAQSACEYSSSCQGVYQSGVSDQRQCSTTLNNPYDRRYYTCDLIGPAMPSNNEGDYNDGTCLWRKTTDFMHSPGFSSAVLSSCEALNMSGCGDLFERCKQCAAGCSSALADREWSESSDVGNALSLAVAYSGFLGFYWEAMLPQWFSNRGQQEEYKQWNWGQFSVKMHSAAVIDEQVNKMVHDLASGFADLFKSIAKSFPSSQATPSPTSWLDLDGFVDSLALFDYALVGRQMESLYGALAHINADRIYTSMEKVLEYVDPIPDTASLSTMFDWVSKAAALLKGVPPVTPVKEPSASAADSCPNLIVHPLNGLIFDTAPGKNTELIKAAGKIVDKFFKTDWMLQYTAKQCRVPSPYTKRLLQHANVDRMNPFDSEAAAQDACNLDDDCTAVYDDHCDSQGTFFTVRSFFSDTSQGDIGGCLWEKGECLKWEDGPRRTLLNKDFTVPKAIGDDDADRRKYDFPAKRVAASAVVKEITKALPGGDVSKTPYSKFDKVGWLTEQLKSSWGEVGSDCVRLLAVAKALDWKSLNGDAREYLTDAGMCKHKGDVAAGEDACPVEHGLDLDRIAIFDVAQQVCEKLVYNF